MTKTFTAPFVQKARTKMAVVTGACVIGTAGAPTNTVLLFTAGSDDSIMTGLSAMPRGTVSANIGLVLFLSKDGGITKEPVDSEVMGTYTLSPNTKVPKTVFTRYNEITPRRMEAGDQLYVGAMVALAAGIVFEAETSDY